MNNTMDSIIASERYELMMNSAIRYNNIEFIKSFKTNPEYLDELMNYYEKKENYERCFWIYEMKKSFILNLKRPNEFYNNTKFSNDLEKNNHQFKMILMDVIFYRKNQQEKRFKSYRLNDVDGMISFFESVEDFEKCYWLYEIKHHYQFEIMDSFFRLGLF